MARFRSLDRRALGVGVALGLVSVVVAVCAGWISRADWRPGSLVIPWGLVLGIAGAVAVGFISRSVSRVHGAVAVGGWILGVALWLRPGEAVIAADAWGYAFLLLPTAALLGMTVRGGAPT